MSDDSKHNKTEQTAAENITVINGNLSIGNILQTVQYQWQLISQQRDTCARRELLNELKRRVSQWEKLYLYNNKILEPLLEEKNELINHLYGEEGIPGRASKNEVLQKSIVEVFDQPTITGKLLILGGAGAGKTTAKIQLVKELITRAESNHSYPIPLCFDLSSWDEKPIEKWLLSELRKVYGTSKYRRKLLKTLQFVPVLDNLDQLEMTRQGKCITAINDFLKKYQPEHLVVCCRLDEYINRYRLLNLYGSVCLQSFSKEQIKEYLKNARTLDLSELIDSADNKLNLCRFAQTPLFLYMLCEAYKKINLDIWKNINSDKERLNYLFDMFIDRILEQALEDARKRRKYLAEKKKISKTKTWLGFIAKNIKRDTYFLIEKMQPSWLQNRNQELQYRFITALLVTLLTWPISIIIGCAIIIFKNEPSNSLRNSLPICITIGFALIASVLMAVVIDLLNLVKEIKPVETLKLPGLDLINMMRFAQFKERLSSSFLLMVGRSVSHHNPVNLVNPVNSVNSSISSHTSINNTKSSSPIEYWIQNVAWGILGWLVPLLVLIRGLTGSEIDINKKAVPNQGIRDSARNTIFFASIFGLLGLMIGMGFGHYEASNNSNLKQELIMGLLGVLVGGLHSGLPCIQHLALRYVLWRSGSIPWNYASFLKYTTKYRLTQIDGGRYFFMHNLLQNYFFKL